MVTISNHEIYFIEVSFPTLSDTIILKEILTPQHDFTGDKKDHKTLEGLRNEMQEIINELKEKTNFYMTQQLIQVKLHDKSI